MCESEESFHVRLPSGRLDRSLDLRPAGLVQMCRRSSYDILVSDYPNWSNTPVCVEPHDLAQPQSWLTWVNLDLRFTLRIDRVRKESEEVLPSFSRGAASSNLLTGLSPRRVWARIKTNINVDKLNTERTLRKQQCSYHWTTKKSSSARVFVCFHVKKSLFN